MKPASATRSGECRSIASASAASLASREGNSRSSTTRVGMPACAANFRPPAPARLLITAATFAGSPARTIASMLLPRPEMRTTICFMRPFYRGLPRRRFSRAAATRTSLLAPCGSGRGESRQGLQPVRLEQLLQLLGRLLGGLDELGLVVLDRVLRIQPRLVVSLEQGHGPLRGGGVESEGKQGLPGHFQARREGFAPDEIDAEVPQAEQMHAIAGAGENRNLREMLADDRRRLHRSLDIVDREDEELRFAHFRRLEQLQARGVAVVHLAAEAPHEIDLLVARLERGEGNAAHAQHA